MQAGRTILFLFLVIVAKPLEAQLKIALPPSEMKSELAVDREMLTAKFELSHITLSKLEIDGSHFVSLSFPGSFPTGRPGMPQIPAFSRLIETVSADSYKFVTITLDSVVIDLDDYFPGALLMPVQESQQKGRIQESKFLREYTAEYLDMPPSDSLIFVEQQGVMRGVSIGRLQFAPFRYDPTANRLTVFYSASFQSRQNVPYGGSGAELRSSVFEKALSPVTRIQGINTLKRLVSEEPITMVILSDSIFRDALQTFVEWKTEKGFRVIEAYTNNPLVGNTNSSIRAYMEDIYKNPPPNFAPPSYLLIAGDVEHVPLSQSTGQITDLYYTTFDGEGDYLPEIFHGRISVKNDTQLTDVLNKILLYEKYQFPDPTFLNRSIFIAGYDASYASVHGNGQINYASEYYFNPSNGISANVYYHPQAASLDHEILMDISEGAAMVNYTGHGEYYGWIDPAFRLSHIDTMKNIDKYGLMIGNGCSTNQFNLPGQDCFAEAIIKAKDRGAIGYIGCTNDSYWDEDYYWSVGIGPFSSSPSYEETSSGYYDKLFHQGTEPVESWCPSMGEMIFAGNMTVQQSSSTRKKYYWEIYQIMGDPSLVPWFRVPDNPEVEYPQVLPEEASSMSIIASAYDYIAVSANGNLVHAMHANQFGQATIPLPDSLNGLDLKLVVTGDYRQPFSDSILRDSNLPGYLELLNYSLQNESEVPDGLLSIGEEFSLELSLLNNSSVAIENEELIIESASSFITISDSVYLAGYIAAGDTLSIPRAFRIRAGNVPADPTEFTISIRRKSLPEGNVIFVKEQIHRSALRSHGITWDDRMYGNGNGIIEAGEKILFEWKITNEGSYRSDSIRLGWGENADDNFTEFAPADFPEITSGGSLTIRTSAKVNVSPAANTSFQLALTADEISGLLTDSLTLVFGRQFDDFSTGDLSRFTWINSDAGWRIDSLTYDGAPFSLRSANISHNESTSVKIWVNLAVADTLSFSYKVSSEAGYDYLKFLLDSVRLERWSGEKGWEKYMVPVDSGIHLLEWEYEKDSNTDRGEDAAWIDNIIFPVNSFNSLDLSLLQLTSPLSSKDLGESEEIVLRIANAGRDTIFTYSVACQLDNLPVVSHAYSDTILPGQQRDIRFDEAVDLSEIKEYVLKAIVSTEGDTYPGNDSSAFAIEHYAYPDLSLTALGIDSTSSEFVNLQVEVTNSGNIMIEELNYLYYLDGLFTRNSSLAIQLDPGASLDLAIPLFHKDSIAAGWHEYLIIAADDSVSMNNTVSGSFYVGFLSLKEIEQDYFLVYPNPVEAEFTISLDRKSDLPAELKVYSVKGELIFSSKLHSSISSFKSRSVFSEDGLYFIRIEGEQGGYSAGQKVFVLLP